MSGVPGHTPIFLPNERLCKELLGMEHFSLEGFLVVMLVLQLVLGLSLLGVLKVEQDRLANNDISPWPWIWTGIGLEFIGLSLVTLWPFLLPAIGAVIMTMTIFFLLLIKSYLYGWD
jgi:hypothetical protein